MIHDVKSGQKGCCSFAVVALFLSPLIHCNRSYRAVNAWAEEKENFGEGWQ